ncbi:MAG TPA: methyltransferase domain-containing protein [Candidatus Limnocylindria bacterium]|nr:methyltransferase domain-containing protein [Candidatus Limnocylindria bacterium]
MSFDRLAKHYAWMETIMAGSKLQRCRTAYLDALQGRRSLLLMGEGHGRFLEAVVQACPHSIITCADASTEMLLVAEKRARRAGLPMDRVSFLHVDALQWNPPEGQFDAVVTNFFLDCFTPDQLEIVVDKLSRAAAPQATWLLADFREADAGWPRFRSRWILKSMYWFFVFATRLPARRLTTPDPYLAQAGFRRIRTQLFEWGLLHADEWQRP